MAEIHSRVDNIYAHNKNAFDVLEKTFFDEHSIPHEVTRDAVKQRILGGINNELPRKWLLTPRGIVPSLALYIASMSYLLWCALFGSRQNKVQTDVIFDYWDTKCEDVYGGIIEGLSSVNIAAIVDPVNEKHKYSRVPSSNRFARKIRPYSRRPAGLVFKAHYCRFGVYWSLTKQTNIDFVDLALRLCSEVAGHMTSIDGVTSKVLVSANDNGFTPYKYYLFRSNGIDSIILIQNGCRVETLAFYNSYIYCDYYISWSQKRLDDFYEMHCDNKIALGSSRLSNFLLSWDKKNSHIKFDLLFIEQILDPAHPKSTTYLNFLKNLVYYSIEHPTIRIAYCMRPGRHLSNKALIRKIGLILQNSPIAILEPQDSLSSYERISNSSLIIALDSSMRFEALALGKSVISCSNRGESDDFIVRHADPIFIIATEDKDVFSEKVDYLLNNLESPLVSKRLANLREMTLGKAQINVTKGITELIKSELHRHTQT